MAMNLSNKQREALTSVYVTSGDTPDIWDYRGPLGWHNRERVLSALQRRGLLHADGTLTDAGVALAERLMGISE
jgi:hypothetical protein